MFVTNVMSDAAALLNDPSKLTWTDAILLPFYQRAHKEVIQAYENHGSPILREVSVLTTIAIGATSISTITDIRTPLTLWERLSGSTDLFTEMHETDWEPEVVISDSLVFWNWREATIVFIGATTARQVKLRYIKTMDAPASANTSVTIPEADLYLSTKTASLAAGVGGGNLDRATELAAQAEMYLFQLLNNQIQGIQGIPVRKKGYRA